MFLNVLTLAFAGPNTALVGVEAAVDAERLRAAAPAWGGEVRQCYRRARFCVVDFKKTPPLSELRTLHGVRYAEQDSLIGAQRSLPADREGTEDCDDLWELAELGMTEAWTAAGTSAGEAPVVAVADSGFLTSHEELIGHISGQFDYGNGDSIAEVEWQAGIPDHGTFIGGLIAGNGDNGVGRSGILPDGRLNLLKIADSDGSLYFSYAASALADVADGDLGIGVVNYSIAGSSDNAAFRDAVAALGDVGVVLVAAAGNCTSANCADADNDRFPLYPASYDMEHVISVAGSTRTGGYNSYSHYGQSTVDLAAPGVDLCSAGVDSTSNYYVASGTSYATPLVAGAAALTVGVHPDLEPAEVRRVLRASARPEAEWAMKVRAGGVLDVAAALSTAVPRLAKPADLRVDERDTLVLQWENPGAEGEAWLLVTHGSGVVIDENADWVLTPIAAGEAVDLPDAGQVVLTVGGSLLRAPVAAHQAQTLRLGLRGAERGAWPLTVRLVFSSSGADYLNSPYDEGTLDASGYLSWPLTVDVTAVAPATQTPDPGDPGDSGEEEREKEDSDEEPSACGCGAAEGARGLGAPWIWAFVGGLTMSVGRRRRR